MHLSEHFIYRWQRRVGSLPTPELVKALIRGAVRLQRGVIGVDECGDRFVALSMYWIPEIDAVLKINDMGWPHRAITVITPDVLKKKRVPKTGTETDKLHRPAPRRHQYRAMCTLPRPPEREK